MDELENNSQFKGVLFQGGNPKSMEGFGKQKAFLNWERKYKKLCCKSHGTWNRFTGRFLSENDKNQSH